MSDEGSEAPTCRQCTLGLLTTGSFLVLTLLLVSLSHPITPPLSHQADTSSQDSTSHFSYTGSDEGTSFFELPLTNDVENQLTSFPRDHSLSLSTLASLPSNLQFDDIEKRYKCAYKPNSPPSDSFSPSSSFLSSTSSFHHIPLSSPSSFPSTDTDARTSAPTSHISKSPSPALPLSHSLLQVWWQHQSNVAVSLIYSLLRSTLTLASSGIKNHYKRQGQCEQYQTGEGEGLYYDQHKQKFWSWKREHTESDEQEAQNQHEPHTQQSIKRKLRRHQEEQTHHSHQQQPLPPLPYWIPDLSVGDCLVCPTNEQCPHSIPDGASVKEECLQVCKRAVRKKKGDEVLDCQLCLHLEYSMDQDTGIALNNTRIISSSNSRDSEREPPSPPSSPSSSSSSSSASTLSASAASSFDSRIDDLLSSLFTRSKSELFHFGFPSQTSFSSSSPPSYRSSSFDHEISPSLFFQDLYTDYYQIARIFSTFLSHPNDLTQLFPAATTTENEQHTSGAEGETRAGEIEMEDHYSTSSSPISGRGREREFTPSTGSSPFDTRVPFGINQTAAAHTAHLIEQQGWRDIDGGGGGGGGLGMQILCENEELLRPTPHRTSTVLLSIGGGGGGGYELHADESVSSLSMDAGAGTGAGMQIYDIPFSSSSSSMTSLSASDKSTPILTVGGGGGGGLGFSVSPLSHLSSLHSTHGTTPDSEINIPFSPSSSASSSSLTSQQFVEAFGHRLRVCLNRGGQVLVTGGGGGGGGHKFSVKIPLTSLNEKEGKDEEREREREKGSDDQLVSGDVYTHSSIGYHFKYELDECLFAKSFTQTNCAQIKPFPLTDSSSPSSSLPPSALPAPLPLRESSPSSPSAAVSPLSPAFVPSSNSSSSSSSRPSKSYRDVDAEFGQRLGGLYSQYGGQVALSVHTCIKHSEAQMQANTAKKIQQPSSEPSSSINTSPSSSTPPSPPVNYYQQYFCPCLRHAFASLIDKPDSGDQQDEVIKSSQEQSHWSPFAGC